MRRFKFVFALLLLGCFNKAICLKPQYAAIVVEANSGRVLEQANADVTCHPASLAKMMTLYMVFEALNAKKIRMDTRIPISSHAARQIPCKLGLRPGERVSLETLIKGMITKSANDASAAIAEYLGGSEANFAVMMTRKAKRLQMHRTVFKNASGVPNPQQVTTARDMAILSRSLYLHFPKRYHHFGLQTFRHRGNVHRNHNRLLGGNGVDDMKVDGIKTGFVAASGFNLAASAVRVGPNKKPKRLIAIVLGGRNRHWRDDRVKELLEVNFQKMGLGRGAFVREVEADDPDVRSFLKEKMGKNPSIKMLPRSIPISLSSPPPHSKLKRQNVLKTSKLGVKRSPQKVTRLKVKKTVLTLKPVKVSDPKISKRKKSFQNIRLVKVTKIKAKPKLTRKKLKKNKKK